MIENALMRMESQEDNCLFFIIEYRSKGCTSVRTTMLPDKINPGALLIQIFLLPFATLIFRI